MNQVHIQNKSFQFSGEFEIKPQKRLRCRAVYATIF